jgi:hypothetical protein
MRAGEVLRLADEIGKVSARLDVRAHLPAIDRQYQRCHALSA